MALKKIFALSLLAVSYSAIAADTAAKEELTAPPAEGALTAAQIPPIMTLDKPLPSSTAPSTTPAPNPSTTPQIGNPPSHADASNVPEGLMVLN